MSKDEAAEKVMVQKFNTLDSKISSIQKDFQGQSDKLAQLIKNMA